jgi:hypothetical protein
MNASNALTKELVVYRTIRMNTRTGLFVDWRRVFAQETEDYHLFRFGVKLAF